MGLLYQSYQLCSALSEIVSLVLGQELLLDFAAWLDLTSNADNTITVYQLPSKFRTHFDSLKHADDLRVYEGFMMPLNHRAGIEGTLKQC